MNPFKSMLGLVMFAYILHVNCKKVAGVESLDYKIRNKFQDYEERLYPPSMWASVVLHGPLVEQEKTASFGKLYDYFHGHNVRGMHINHTMPVRMMVVPCQEATCAPTAKLSFLIPAALSENIPAPLDKNVFIEKDRARCFAVSKMKGRPTEEGWLEQAHLLAKAVQDDLRVNPAYFFVVWYNSPYYLLDQTMEVWMNKRVPPKDFLN